MQIEVLGVKIELTKSQLEQIAQQTRKNRPITERIQTFQDVLDELGEPNWKEVYPNTCNKEEKYVSAYAKIAKITKVYNEGVELNWKDSSQYKWYVYKYWSGGLWAVNFDCYGSDLYCSSGFGYYKSEALCKDAYSKFKNIYEDYWGV